MGATWVNNTLVLEGRNWRWETVSRDCGRVKKGVPRELVGDHRNRIVLALGCGSFLCQLCGVLEKATSQPSESN